MTRRVLVAVDDSPGSLAAARTAIALSRDLGARLRAVHVRADGHLASAIATGSPHPATRPRWLRAGPALLDRVVAMGAATGVTVETELLEGDVVAAVLDVARRWHADLVVVGRAARPGFGEPTLGAHALQLVEFADEPVLVVPAGGSEGP